MGLESGERRRQPMAGKGRSFSMNFGSRNERQYSGTGRGRRSGAGPGNNNRKQYPGKGRGRSSEMHLGDIDEKQYSDEGKGRYSGMENAGGKMNERFYNDNRPFDEPVYTGPPDTDSNISDLETLKQRANILEKQLNDLLHRIHALENEPESELPLETTKTITMKAVINESLCVGCGICERVCPVQAIHMNEIAHVDAALCTGCGSCVQSCRRRAITLMHLEQDQEN